MKLNKFLQQAGHSECIFKEYYRIYFWYYSRTVQLDVSNRTAQQEKKYPDLTFAIIV